MIYNITMLLWNKVDIIYNITILFSFSINEITKYTLGMSRFH